MKKIILILSTIVLLLTMSGCNKSSSNDKYNNESIVNSTQKETGYKKVDVYHTKEVKRVLPKKVTNGGLSEYPIHNTVITNSTLKAQILAESNEMFNFDSLDKNGNYYLNGIKTNQSLFKHTVSDEMYPSKVSDKEKAVEKYMHINNYGFDGGVNESYGAISTGLYAAPGELIKVEIDEKFINDGLRVHVGKMSSKGSYNSIPSNKDYSRMPLLTKSVPLDSTTTYIGNPLGGLVYIFNDGKRIDMDIKISGAVEATHYIVGSSTKEELEHNLNSTAPLMEVEVPGQIFANMPKAYCGELSADIIIAALDQWDKMTALSLHVNPSKNNYLAHGVSSLYDSYRPAGVATAVIGPAHSANPEYWADDFFNVNSPDWGGFHEYNHHYGGYDIIDNETTSEVANNLITLMGYVLYTNYNGQRSSDNFGYEGWVGQANQSYAMNLINTENKWSFNYDLAQYAVLMHAFGVDKMLEIIKHEPNASIKNNSKADRFFAKVVEVTGYDMTYYFNDFSKDICNSSLPDNSWTISEEARLWVDSLNLDMFIPVGHEFQLGQTHSNLDTEYSIRTMQPFAYFQNERLSLNKYITVPFDMDYEIIGVSKPSVGTITKVNKDHFYESNFTPNTIDEFQIKVRVFNEEYESIQTLDLGLCHQTGMYTSAKTSIYDNKDNLSIDDIDFNNIQLEEKQVFTLTTPLWGFNVSSSIYSSKALFVNESSLFFDESTTKTFYFKGKGDIKVYIGTNHNNLEEIVSFSDQSNYDLNSRSYKLNVKKDQKYYLRVVSNAKTRSEFGMATHDGTNFVTVNENEYYSRNSTQTEINNDYYKPLYDYNRFDASVSGKNLIYKNYANDEAHVEYQTSSLLADAFKGNTTKMYSAIPGSEVIFDYNESILANGITFHAAWNHKRTIKDYEVWVGDDPRALTKIHEDQGTHSTLYTSNFDKTYKFRYVKIVFISCQFDNNIGVYSITLNHRMPVNYLNATNSDILYNGYAKEVKSHSSYGGNIVEFDGELKFDFIGSSFNLYATLDNKYGFIELKIDNGDWITIDLSNNKQIKNSEIFTIKWLEDTKHTITIRSNGLANIDFVRSY